MAKLPYPPAPELGWYSDDPVEGTPDSAVGTAEPVSYTHLTLPTKA